MVDKKHIDNYVNQMGEPTVSNPVEAVVILPATTIKCVMWPWMRPKVPFRYLGVMANSFRDKHDKGQWVIIQDIENGKIYEVLDCDLKPLNLV